MISPYKTSGLMGVFFGLGFWFLVGVFLVLVLGGFFVVFFEGFGFFFSIAK